MKNPNGYGTVYKKSGKLRKPWYAQKTVRWDDGKQQVRTIGTYATRQEAMRALAEYNGQPYDLDIGYTVGAVYESYMKDHPEFTDSQRINRKFAFTHLREFHSRPFRSVRVNEWERVINEMDTVLKAKETVKRLIREMYTYCQNKGMPISNGGDAIKISKDAPTARKKRGSMTMPEVITLWDHQNEDMAALILIFIYSGMRISEFCNLRKEDVDLQQRYFKVKDAKTEAGERTAPIAKVVLPLWERLQSNHPEYFFGSPTGVKWQTGHLRDNYFCVYLKSLGMDYTPHATRHTCISVLQLAKVPSVTIKQMVGHKGSKDLTERVYTHIPLPAKLEAIDLMHPTVLKYASLTEL